MKVLDLKLTKTLKALAIYVPGVYVQYLCLLASYFSYN